MKSLKYALAAALATAALPGTAEAAEIIAGSTTVQTSALDAGANNSFTIGFSESNLANPFNELLTFTTDVAGMLNLLVSTVGASAENNVTFSNIFLTGTGLPNPNGVPLSQVLADPNDTFVRNMIAVGPGTYTLNIQGTPGTQNGSLSGNVSFTSVAAAVPEPGTWALMLVGFGAVGFSMRRRRSATAHLFQAA